MICSILPFLLEYNDTKSVELCSAVTSCTANGVKVYPLIFGQGLWFGEIMELSLINLNQCRDFGMQICDDPTDPNRGMGFCT